MKLIYGDIRPKTLTCILASNKHKIKCNQLQATGQGSLVVHLTTRLASLGHTATCTHGHQPTHAQPRTHTRLHQPSTRLASPAHSAACTHAHTAHGWPAKALGLPSTHPAQHIQAHRAAKIKHTHGLMPLHPLAQNTHKSNFKN